MGHRPLVILQVPSHIGLVGGKDQAKMTSHIIQVVKKPINQVYHAQNNMITNLLNCASKQSLIGLCLTNPFNKTKIL